ncbi:DNA-directed RNA polymerase III subunit Rpc5 [Ochromonadaceae sp. CCMP2298]|nr:DNA-directed RNA polymerase III subunit Rpc5 [Ochromonadaceae sp. CCMP2298]|mmetsp:Transcript_30268/g.66993  ORF Transcript_30268/g.66993 Transcript_30268/m.66993 type:complete len:210 (+) Transcript_30268:142-771(+)
MDASGDEVIRELDVFLSDDPSLVLLQFPLKPVYADSINVEAARYKPHHKLLELELPFNLPYNYDAETQKNIPATQTYSSQVVAHGASLGAAIVKNNAMYITPIDSVLQLRPSFKNLHTLRDMEVVESMPEDDEAYPEAESEALQQVQLKRKESERAQSARVQSFAYVNALLEQEPWQDLDIHEIGSAQSEKKFLHMSGATGQAPKMETY